MSALPRFVGLAVLGDVKGQQWATTLRGQKLNGKQKTKNSLGPEGTQTLLQLGAR